MILPYSFLIRLKRIEAVTLSNTGTSEVLYDNDKMTDIAHYNNFRNFAYKTYVIYIPDKMKYLEKNKKEKE